MNEILNFIKFDCEKMKTEPYSKMHKYFEQLSKVAGFSEKELVSLYDLPAIVATLNITRLSSPSFLQLFLYSRCKEKSYSLDMSGIPFAKKFLDKLRDVTWNKQECFTTWSDFAINPKGIIILLWFC